MSGTQQGKSHLKSGIPAGNIPDNNGGTKRFTTDILTYIRVFVLNANLLLDLNMRNL